MTKGKKIPKNHLRYYKEKMVYIQWKFSAFMCEKIEICKVIDETTLKSQENENVYKYDNNLIDDFYEVKEGFGVLKKEEQLYSYIVNCEVGSYENANSINAFIQFKQIKSNDDVKALEKMVLAQVQKDYEVSKSCPIQVKNITLLNY